MAALINRAELLQPTYDRLLQADSVIWNLVNHDTKLFNSNAQIKVTRLGVVPMFDVQQTGQAPAKTADGREIGQQIYIREDDTNKHYTLDSIKWDNYRSFVAMEQHNLKIQNEWAYSAAFPTMNDKLTDLPAQMGEFAALQVDRVVIPKYDATASTKIADTVPAENRFQLDWATGNAYETFSALNDNIKNAMFTDPSGIELPQKGSGKKIAVCTSTWLKRLIHDLPNTGAYATESDDKRKINGFSGSLLGWDFVECHAGYMPFVETGVDTQGNPIFSRVECLMFDPDPVIAPILLDAVYHDDTKINGMADFLNAHHFWDCVININHEAVANGAKDREQLFGLITFSGTRPAGGVLPPSFPTP